MKKIARVTNILATLASFGLCIASFLKDDYTQATFWLLWTMMMSDNIR